MRKLVLASAISLLALVGGASIANAAPVINVLLENVRTNAAPVADQFANVGNFGTGLNAQIGVGGVFGDLTISSINGGTANSGIFAGNLLSPALEASVFGDFNSTRGYLAAGGNGGVVNIASAAGLRNDLFMLWGTVDRGTVRNVIQTNGGDIITGEDVWNAMSAAGRANGDGNTNVWLHITGLNAFNGAAFRDDGANSFEFTVQQGVPEPATWAMLMIGFAGIGIFGMRKRKAIQLRLT